ncbi:MAG: hypothetical protein GY851_18330 [bacterium]|nr:hypothetical protein [bacterium]
MADSDRRAPVRLYIGVFLIALSTLMYETLLTRVFSVTMWYHFAFMAISVAMFGMAFGAILVYFLPRHFRRERIHERLTQYAFGFAISCVLSFLAHMVIPIVDERSILGAYSLVLNYAMITVPFVFSGICICLVLTGFPSRVGKLYAADLAGAALGCILFIQLLRITDGPTAVVFVGALAALSAFSFSVRLPARGWKYATAVLTVVLAASAISNTLRYQANDSQLRLLWIKGNQETRRPLHVRWNSLSRIVVDGDPYTLHRPFAWGISTRHLTDVTVRGLGLTIDARAGTFLAGFDGDLSAHEYLNWDVTNLCHRIRHDADVFVIGTGGGRDILSALVSGQRSVVGAEINGVIIDTLNGTFGDFSGHLDQHPDVEFVNDEARSYLARSDKTFDIVQISLIDTWAATAAGAFVLAENTLYTREAFDVFFDRLTDRGVLSVSRWYTEGSPAEMYRTAALAASALRGLGIENPENNIIVAYIPQDKLTALCRNGVGTLLVSKSPFSESDIDTIEGLAGDLDYHIVASPRGAADSTWSLLVSGRGVEQASAELQLDISPPTDNQPFFFNMIRIGDLLAGGENLTKHGTALAPNLKAVFTLVVLASIVLALTLLLTVAPFALAKDRPLLRANMPFLVYFAAIGLGFMLVEISQMQRLIVFLGHPTYGLSVVLFTILLSSGVGSFVSPAPSEGRTLRAAAIALTGLVIAVLLYGALSPGLHSALRHTGTPVRILVAIGTLAPVGFFMGMAFPIGVGMASALGRDDLTPWLWAINGATSVCASVIAVVIALWAGISTSLWAGLACYAFAGAAFLALSRRLAAHRSAPLHRTE